MHQRSISSAFMIYGPQTGLVIIHGNNCTFAAIREVMVFLVNYFLAGILDVCSKNSGFSDDAQMANNISPTRRFQPEAYTLPPPRFGVVRSPIYELGDFPCGCTNERVYVLPRAVHVRCVRHQLGEIIKRTGSKITLFYGKCSVENRAADRAPICSRGERFLIVEGESPAQNNG